MVVGFDVLPIVVLPVCTLFELLVNDEGPVLESLRPRDCCSVTRGADIASSFRDFWRIL